jgi:hypothetical protein
MTICIDNIRVLVDDVPSSKTSTMTKRQGLGLTNEAVRLRQPFNIDDGDTCDGQRDDNLEAILVHVGHSHILYEDAVCSGAGTPSHETRSKQVVYDSAETTE